MGGRGNNGLRSSTVTESLSTDSSKRNLEVKAPSKKFEEVFEAANNIYKNWCDNFDKEFEDFFADEDEGWGPEDMTKAEKIDAMLESIESELDDQGFSDSEIGQVLDASDKFRKLLNKLI